jgi:hypothetical protein
MSNGLTKLFSLVSVVEGDITAGLHDAHGSSSQDKSLKIKA